MSSLPLKPAVSLNWGALDVSLPHGMMFSAISTVNDPTGSGTVIVNFSVPDWCAPLVHVAVVGVGKCLSTWSSW